MVKLCVFLRGEKGRPGSGIIIPAALVSLSVEGKAPMKDELLLLRLILLPLTSAKNKKAQNEVKKNIKK